MDALSVLGNIFQCALVITVEKMLFIYRVHPPSLSSTPSTLLTPQRLQMAIVIDEAFSACTQRSVCRHTGNQ